MWIRVGLDEVPLWKAHVVACAVAPCAHLRSLPMQSPHWHFVFCLLRGTESKEVVAEMLRHCKVVEDLQKLDGSTVFIQGKQYTVRVFLCGDHVFAKTTSKHANTRQNTHVSCGTSRQCAASSWAPMRNARHTLEVYGRPKHKSPKAPRTHRRHPPGFRRPQTKPKRAWTTPAAANEEAVNVQRPSGTAALSQSCPVSPGQHP